MAEDPFEIGSNQGEKFTKIAAEIVARGGKYSGMYNRTDSFTIVVH